MGRSGGIGGMGPGVANPIARPGVCGNLYPLAGFNVDAEFGVDDVSSQLVIMG
jgi:hypothetical protein